MSQWLTLSRAAHLLGISRIALQKQIRDGELQSFDGMVAADDLQRTRPELDLEESGSFEKTRAIREDAFAKRLRERILPTQEALAQRLFAQGQELTELQRTLTRYHALFESLQARLAAASPSATVELIRLLEEGLAEALAAPAPKQDVAALDAMLSVMSAHVTVKPSGREFFVEGSDTLLKAALRAGLAPNYGCGNGICGLCKARVVAGEARAVLPYDYRFSEAEKAQNHILMCACTALSSELVLEVLEAGVPEDIPEQRIVARVRSVDRLSDEVMRLHLQMPRSNRLRFLAGQRVTLGVSAGAASGSDLHGEYPVASCPCDDRNLLFHVGRTEGHAATHDFAQCVFDGRIKAGHDISVWGPWGSFVLEQGSLRPLVFIAIDLGFAPVSSLIEHAIAVDAAESISLYWASSRPAGQYLPNQCRAWAEALDEFDYLPLTTDELPAVLAANGTLPLSDIYLAGTADRVESLAAALLSLGVPPGQLHVEAL